VQTIFVIDQSEAADSEHVVASHALASRIQYVRQTGGGVSRARNAAVVLAGDVDVVVFIDDDCTAEPGWLEAMVGPLADPRIALVYGRVDSIDHDREQGFIAGWAPSRRRVLRGRIGKLQDAGAMGASRAIRARVARDLTFDEMLGPGAPLHAAEDMDFGYRLLKAGWWIAHEPAAAVLHWGYRGFNEGSRLMWNISGGIAATYVKQIRCGDTVAVLLFAHEAWRATENLLRRVLRFERPFGVRRVAGFLVGTIVAARIPVDRESGLYRSETIVGAAGRRPLKRKPTETQLGS
jgi:GT2 family glycosyltransferase